MRSKWTTVALVVVMIVGATLFMWRIGSHGSVSGHHAASRAESEAIPVPTGGSVIGAESGRPLDGATLFLPGTGDSSAVPLTLDDAGRFDPRNLMAHANRRGLHRPLLFLPVRLSRWAIRHTTVPGVRFVGSQASIPVLLSRFPKAQLNPDGKSDELQFVAPPTGEVEMTVRDDEGEPLVERLVDVYAVGGNFNSHDALRLIGVTDADGKLRVRWWTGICRFVLVVAGTGTSATGVFEVLPNENVTPELPRLARFGRIEGRVPDEVIDEVKQMSIRYQVWNQSVADVYRDGSFTLLDVTPGWHHLSYSHAATRGSLGIDVEVLPGATVTGVELPHPLNLPKTAAETKADVAPPARTLSVSGVVTNLRGRPMASHRVYWCRGNSHSSDEQIVRVTTTDSEGAYAFADVPWHGSWLQRQAAIVVAQPNAPPALLRLDRHHFESVTEVQARPDVWNLQADVTVPDDQASLTVQVFSHGQPCRDAFVQISDEYARTVLGNIQPAWRNPSDIDARVKELVALFRTFRRVDRHGIVRFTGLIPGRHRVTAVSGVPDDQVAQFVYHDRNDMRLGNRRPDWQLRNIDIDAGNSNQLRMTLQPQVNPVPVIVEQPDGSVLRHGDASLGFSRDGPYPSWAQQFRADQLSIKPRFPGLRHVGVWSRRSGAAARSIGEGPVFVSGARIAVSRLFRGSVLRLKSEFFGEDTQTLTVRLTDRHGAAVRGTINIFRVNHTPHERFSASTNPAGVVRFSSLPEGNYRVRGFIDGTDRPPDPGPDMTDEELTGHGLVPYQDIEIRRQGPYEITLHEQLVGYVRCRVQFAAGMDPNDHGFTAREPRDPNVGFRGFISISGYPAPWYSKHVRRPTVHFDRDASSIVCGPFLTPSAEIVLTPNSTGFYNFGSELHKQQFAVEPGKLIVHDMSISPPESKSSQSSGTDWITQLRTDLENHQDELSLQVLRADGSPAGGARLDWFLASKRYVAPTTIGRTNPHGRLTVSMKSLPVAYSYAPDDDRPDESTDDGTPDQRGFVVALAGYVQGMFVPIPDEHPNHLEIQLPPPTAVQGRVTVAGQSPDRFGDSVRVVARGQQLGRLSESYSYDFLAESDGTFELRGLTPGTYAIQASLDDIWLSETVHVNVPPDNSPSTLPPLELVIANPGSAAHIQIVDARKKPLPFQPVRVHFPVGPIKDQLHEMPLTTNGQGMLRIDGCTAGRHTFTLDGSTESVSFNVPPHNGPDDNLQIVTARAIPD